MHCCCRSSLPHLKETVYGDRGSDKDDYDDDDSDNDDDDDDDDGVSKVLRKTLQ